jgi:hypothetical protein
VSRLDLQGIEAWKFGESFGPSGYRYNYSLGNLFGLDVSLRWDPTILQYINHTVKIPVEDYGDGILHEPIFDYREELNPLTGAYRVAKTSMGQVSAFNSPNRNATIFNMTFLAKENTSSSLNISDSKLAVPTPFPGLADVFRNIPHRVLNSKIEVFSVDPESNYEGSSIPQTRLIPTIAIVGISSLIGVFMVHGIYHYNSKHKRTRIKRKLWQMPSRKPLNYYLMKVNRAIVWLLLLFMVILIISGYGLTKPNLITSLSGGLIDYQAARYLHTILDAPLMILLLVHVMIEIKFSFVRWGFKNKSLLNSIIFILGLTILLLFLYMDSALS